MILLDGRTIRIIQANYGAIAFDFYSPDNLPFDLSSYTVTFMVKQSKTDSDSDAVITKTFEENTGNTIEIELSPEDTNIPVNFYWWSICLTGKENLYKNEALSGRFYIIEGVQD